MTASAAATLKYSSGITLDGRDDLEQPTERTVIDVAQLAALRIRARSSPGAGAIDLSAIDDVVQTHLRALCSAKISAAEDYSGAVKAAAERAGIQPAALSAYITAVVRETADKLAERARQLSLLFDELGE